MAVIVLDRADYRDKVYACWLGKNIGGTLGAPFEGKKQVNALVFYDPVPTEPAPNDDLDLQLVWLCMLEERGTDLSVADFAEYWKRYLMAYPWNEYGFCARNLERGLMPPMSGWFENYYVDEMGSPIRSEVWACVAPADPQRAAALAWMDSAMDHAGGEGMWGEMLWAAVESGAFVMSDPLDLIRIGLNMIPSACAIARVIREAVWLWQNGVPWAEARDRIVQVYGHAQPCHAVQNHGFIVLGWLYGEGFGDRLCKAVNCGYDTDCTGATLGALLGILGGRAGIPGEWSDPVGSAVVLHQFTGPCDAPRDLEELTARTAAAAEQFAADDRARVAFGEHTRLASDMESRLLRNDDAAAAMREDLRAAVVRRRDLEIILHYHGDPVLEPRVARRLTVECRRRRQVLDDVRVEMRAPNGWEVKRQEEPQAFVVTPAEFQEAAEIEITAAVGGEAYTAGFTVLSPSAAVGFPSARNVEYCPRCQARQGSCVCARPGRA